MAVISIVTDAGDVGVELVPDIAMTAQSLFAYDFSDTRCWPGGNASAGANINNLLVGGAIAQVNPSGTGLTFNTDGFRFSVATTTQTIFLPDSVKMAGSVGFMVSCWLTAETQTQAAKSKVAGYFDATDNTGPWGIYVLSNTFYFVVNSQVVASITPTALGLRKVHQIVLAWVNAGDVETPDWRARLYVDGALHTDVAAIHSTLQAPTNTTDARIGDLHGSGGSSGYWIGKFCRVLGWDLAGYDDDRIGEIIDLDWDEHSFADAA